MSTCTAVYKTSAYVKQERVAVEVFCFREVDAQNRHRGGHQGWQAMPRIKAGDHGSIAGRLQPAEDIPPWARLWTWSEGGATGDTRQDASLLMACDECGTLFQTQRDDKMSSDSHSPARKVPDPVPPDGRTCWRCRLWVRRALEFAEPGSRWVRPHDEAPFGDTAYLYSWSPGSSDGFAGRCYRVTWDDGRTVGPASSLWGAGHIPWEFEDRFPPNARIMLEQSGGRS